MNPDSSNDEQVKPLYGEFDTSSFSSYRTEESSVVTSNSISSEPEKVQEIDAMLGGRKGLKNLGNTCYLNSTLQCLLSADELSFKLATLVKDGQIDRKARLTYALAQLFQELWKRPASSSPYFGGVDSRIFKAALSEADHRFEGYRQEDSQEALAIILDRIHEETKMRQDTLTENSSSDPDGWLKYCDKENSLIRELFHGQIRSTLTCSSCGHASQIYDPFCFLNLPIPHEKAPEPIVASKSKNIKIACYNETITNESNAYLKLCKNFSGLNEFKNIFTGSGFCVLKLGFNGEISNVFTKLSALDELQLSSKIDNSLIAFRIDYSCTSYIVHLVLDGFYGLPVKVSLSLSESFTEESFVKAFFRGTMQGLVKIKFPDYYEAFKALLKSFEEDPKKHFKIVGIKSVNTFLNIATIEIIESEASTVLFGNDLDTFFASFTDKAFEDEKDASNERESYDHYGNKPSKPAHPSQVKLLDCIEAYLAKESLKAECERCKTSGPAQKKLDLWRLPPILILHLKRFSYSTSHPLYTHSYFGSSGAKITSRVDFPVTVPLQLHPLSTNQAVEYELFAVSQHFGSINFGHYTAITWHRQQQCWALADDGSITKYSSPEDWINGAQEAAYVLFYRIKQ